MAAYEYSHLLDAHNDIRLLELLSDEGDQEIHIRLFHVILDDSFVDISKRTAAVDLKHLAHTMPPGWDIRETCSGRIAFLHLETDTISWVHPDPQISASSYQQSNDVVFTHPTVPEFEALSYTWGSADHQETIYVEVMGNGTVPESRTLLVQPNLATALRSLRRSLTPRTLWIDAVCINQKEVKERNIQVCRMAAIYTLAQRVIVWLGPDSHNSGLAMSTLSHLGSQITYCKSHAWYASPGTEHVEWHRSTATLPYSQEVWRSILELVKRPWFTRLWVTQEVHLANQHALVCCGSDEVSWEKFRASLAVLGGKQKTELPELRQRLTQISSLARTWSGRPMQTLLKWCEDRECSDPRDKIYGLLGLAPAKLAENIKPNYLASVEDVYRDAVVVLLKQTRRLYLANCGRSLTYPGLPTWVPDFSKSFASRFDDLGFCSGFSRAEFYTEGRSILKVRGLRRLRVSEVCQPIRIAPEDAREDLRHAETLRAWARQVASQTYPTGETFLQALAATLVLGQTGGKYISLHLYSTLQEWSAQLHEFLFGSPETRLSELGDKTMFRRMFEGEETLFSTREGFIGLAQCKVQPEDELCAILGCMGMVILRPTISGERPRFEVIGECYVHGLMEMEAFLGPLKSPWVFKNKIKEDGTWYPWYVNSVSGQACEDDPRLGPSPEEWEKITWNRLPEDPLYFVRFKNRVTGEVINSDPRLLPPALRARGISLEWLELV